MQGWGKSAPKPAPGVHNQSPALRSPTAATQSLCTPRSTACWPPCTAQPQRRKAYAHPGARPAGPPCTAQLAHCRCSPHFQRVILPVHASLVRCRDAQHLRPRLPGLRTCTHAPPTPPCCHARMRAAFSPGPLQSAACSTVSEVHELYTRPKMWRFSRLGARTCLQSCACRQDASAISHIMRARACRVVHVDGTPAPFSVPCTRTRRTAHTSSRLKSKQPAQRTASSPLALAPLCLPQSLPPFASPHVCRRSPQGARARLACPLALRSGLSPNAGGGVGRTLPRALMCGQRFSGSSSSSSAMSRMMRWRRSSAYVARQGRQAGSGPQGDEFWRPTSRQQPTSR